MIDVWIPGRPRTKGSLQPQVRHDAQGRVARRRTAAGRETVDVRMVDTPESKAWRLTVATALRDAMIAQRLPKIMRPNRVAGRLVVWVPYRDPTNRLAGDADKHLRQLFDAMTDAGVWEDDAQAAGWYVDKEPALEMSGPGYQVIWGVR